jgi:serine/threonine-protein kinase
MGPIRFISVLAGCCCVGSNVALADNYGAIAFSPSTRSYGWSTDYNSRGEAEQVALEHCRKQAGDCVVPIWFRSSCGALAVGPNGYGSGWGLNRSQAEQKALESCGKHNSTNCSIRHWTCTSR